MIPLIENRRCELAILHLTPLSLLLNLAGGRAASCIGRRAAPIPRNKTGSALPSVHACTLECIGYMHWCSQAPRA